MREAERLTDRKLLSGRCAVYFDAAAAGWKKGLPPFGQYKGKLDDNSSRGRNPWSAKPRTFWENEVLLVRGTWQFPPLKPDHAYRVRPFFKSIELRENGDTDSTSFLWSGDILMDLDHSHALKMTPKTIDGTEYLFVESGGFNKKNPAGWKPQFMVLKRQ